MWQNTSRSRLRDRTKIWLAKQMVASTSRGSKPRFWPWCANGVAMSVCQCRRVAGAASNECGIEPELGLILSHFPPPRCGSTSLLSASRTDQDDHGTNNYGALERGHVGCSCRGNACTLCHHIPSLVLSQFFTGHLKRQIFFVIFLLFYKINTELNQSCLFIVRK